LPSARAARPWPPEAARLGKDLTPFEAERAGNADGSIPEWNPANTVIPPDFMPGSDNYINPYPDETPLYTIDVDNWQDYGAKSYDRKSGAAASGSYDLPQGIYNLNGKPIPDKYRNGFTQNEKYFTPEGLARSGVR